MQAESGEYTCSVVPSKPHYSMDSQLDALLGDPRTKEVIQELFPRAIRGVAFQYEMHTMAQLVASPFSELDDDGVRKLKQALEAIQIANDQ